jgi:hypothetical protein
MNGRYWRGAVAMVAMLSASSQLQAQSTRIFLGGGVGIPLGTYDDVVKMGWEGTAGVSFQPHGFPLGIQVDGSYAQFSDETPLDIKNQLIYGTANVSYRFGSSPGTRFVPYLVGGLGVYHSKGIGDDAFGGSTTKPGMNLGAGFDFGAGSTGLFVEARWHNVFVDGDNLKFLPITLGIRFRG